MDKYIKFFNKYGFIKVDKRIRKSNKVWLNIYNKKYDIYLKAYKDGMVRLYKYWNNPYMVMWEAYQLNKKLKLNNKKDQLNYLVKYIINNKKYKFI